MNVELPEHYVELERVYSRTIARGVHSLAITASEEGEGVTTLVVALAKRNRYSGRSTLVVDLNLHRPALHKRFNLSFIPGPPDGVHGPDALPRVDLGEGLTVMPAPANRGEAVLLRDKQHFDEYLKVWRRQYDVVLFDTTPLNGSNKGNIPAERVCHGCEGSILVVLAGMTPASAVKAGLDRLKAAGVTPIGTVLNDKQNPSLAEELRRESLRFDRLLPGFTHRMRQKIRTSQLLNLET
ncbi:MAG TPA: CpsD/CapB family tyrosine-protein kinase [Lamprocystis sp. (in: g-proteobacteria)]|nr:CpsD/CapB family tyrosine-protein kinase [Lamprocystis sp. (in: g-proteobacteria)]